MAESEGENHEENTLESENILENSVKSKRKKWSWSSEGIDALIKKMEEYKSSCEFKGIDFSADKVELYRQVRSSLASTWPEDFGPVEAQKADTSLKDMSKAECKKFKESQNKELQAIRTGYSRVKEKIKSIRQDYSKAVTTGRRSGGGKIVLEYYDNLVKLWGGSPSTEPLPFGVESNCVVDPAEDENQADDEASVAESLDKECTDGDSFENQLPDSPDCGRDMGDENSSSEASSNPTSRKRKIESKKIPKLVDNKRKNLEKRLSASQRDQKLLESAKEDSIMRKEMLECLKSSTTSTAHAIETMSETPKSLSRGITQGMALLAGALQQSPVPPAQYNPHHQFHSLHVPQPQYQAPYFQDQAQASHTNAQDKTNYYQFS